MDDQNDDDKGLFRRLMQDVKRLKSDKLDLARGKSKTKRSKGHGRSVKSDATHSVRQDVSKQLDYDDEPAPYLREFVTEPVAGEEFMQFSRSSISEKLMRRLKRGKIPIQARLDLHGATVQEAEQELLGFLEHQQRPYQSCVLVIHGKGYRSGEPTLKNRVNNWLRQCSNVVAFCSAQPNDGGTGAVYVLLKKLG